MKLCKTKHEILALSDSWKADGLFVSLVPTMGNLHDGHLSLLERAAECADRVIVSIYVNPLQFAAHEDFDTYPRTIDEDIDKLALTGSCHAIFMPSSMYLDDHATTIVPSGVAEGLESLMRPHFFRGVATVVYQLFTQTGADKAVFGEKDFQQLKVIEQMVRDLHLPIEIIAAPTVRESDGLAMSSRNIHLNKEQRKQAPVLHQALQDAAEAIRAGGEVRTVLTEAKDKILKAGFKVVDYFELCTTDSLKPNLNRFYNNCEKQNLILLTAAHIGNVRLIDNVKLYP